MADRKPLSITVLMDDNCISTEDPDFAHIPSEPSTEYMVVEALRKLGHRVSILGIDSCIDPVVKALSENRPDLVFNLNESFRSQRRFDHNIAGMLELIGVPFTGTGSTGLMLCRNKGLCKQLLSNHKIRVPGFITFAPGAKIRIPRSIRFPLVVKPLYQDGSDGISNLSLVKDIGELNERTRMIHERFKEPAIAEEFIDGRELYVGLIGNTRLQVLPLRELHFGDIEQGGPVIATYKVKWDRSYQEKWHISFGFGELEPLLFRRVGEVCKKVYKILQLEDFGRIDIRLTKDNHIVVLEANPNPAIAPYDDVAQAALRAGISYEELIDHIIQMALKRHGM